jgi:dTDP-4-dehydrorhamnose reductase
MNILVLGAGGMAGHVITLYLRENGFSVDTLSAHNKLDEKTHLIDVTVDAELKDFLENNTYDVVVNCIALLTKPSEEQKALAVYLNAYLPRFLEEHYKDTKTKIIHISTDAVFATTHSPYKEDNKYSGESFYGRTKALGEIDNDKDVSFRLSIVGPSMQVDGSGLFNWFYSQKGEIQGYSNIVWNGITTTELAKAIMAAIEQNVTGIYHLSPKEDISKFDLLQLFKEIFERNDITVKPVEGSAIGTTLINTRKDFDYTIPDYKTMVSEMKTWIENHPKLYPHYEK